MKLLKTCLQRSKGHYPRRGSMGPMTYDFMSSRNEHKLILAYLQDVLDRGVPGSILELGCHNGNTTVMIQRLLRLNRSSREVVVYDSFRGFPDATHAADQGWGAAGELRTSQKKFRATLKKARVLLPRVEQGFFADIPDRAYPDEIAFVFFDGDLYQSTMDALRKIHHKMAPGGVIVFDDYRNPQQGMYPGVRRACDDFYGPRSGVRLVRGSLLGSKDPFLQVDASTISQAVRQYGGETHPS